MKEILLVLGGIILVASILALVVVVVALLIFKFATKMSEWLGLDDIF